MRNSVFTTKVTFEQLCKSFDPALIVDINASYRLFEVILEQFSDKIRKYEKDTTKVQELPSDLMEAFYEKVAAVSKGISAIKIQ